MNIKLTEDFTGLDCAAVRGCINLDNLVVWFKSSLVCWRVLIHSPDELALLWLLAVQIEAIGILYFLNVAKTRAQIVSFLLKTRISQINHYWVQAKMEIYCISNSNSDLFSFGKMLPLWVFALQTLFKTSQGQNKCKYGINDHLGTISLLMSSHSCRINNVHIL